MGGRKEAEQGSKAEVKLIKYFNDASNKMKLVECSKKLGINLPSSFYVLKPQNRVKCDIAIKAQGLASSGQQVCISLKTVTNASFHQLDRRWLDEWRSKLEMPNEVYEILWEAILRKARAESGNRKAVFIPPEHRKVVGEFIKSKLDVIIREVFVKDEADVKILAIWDRTTRGGGELCLFNMDDVISFLSRQEVSFSEEGIVRIGKYVTMQRKGGDGSHVKVPKDDPKHPGNQLQFKFKPLEFMNDMKGKIRSCCIRVADP